MGSQDSTLAGYCRNDNRNDNEINTEVVAGESAAYHKQTIKAKKNKKVDKIKNQLNNALKELEAARQEIHEMKNIHDTKTNTVNMEYTKLNEKYETEYKQKTKLIHQIQESTKKYDKKLEKSQSKTSELQQKFEKYTITAENEVNKYKLSNKRLQQQMSDYNEYKSNTKTLQHENSKLVTIKTSLQNQVTTLSEILYQYKQTESKQSTQIQNLKSQIELLKNTHNIELNEKVKELHEQIETKQTANNVLQQQYDDYKVINEQQITELQGKLDTYEKQQMSEEIDEKEMEIDKYEMTPAVDDADDDDADDDTVLLNYEKNVTDHRVLHTLEKSRTVTDVAKLVIEQYTSRDSADEIVEDEEISNIDTESSYEELEKLEIEKMKSIEKEQKGIDQEAVAMQKQMEEMQRENEVAMRKELESMKKEHEGDDEGSGSDGGSGSDESTTQEISISISVSKEDGGDMSDTEWAKQANISNMFRYKSIAKWTQQDLARQKNEMQAQMIHMVEHHVKSTKNLNVLSDDEKKSNSQ